MIAFVEKIAINMAVKFLKGRIATLIVKDPEVKTFMENLYSKSIPQFMEYGIERLAKKDLDDTTPIQLVKGLIVPMNDGTEVIINKFLDGLDPRSN